VHLELCCAGREVFVKRIIRVLIAIVALSALPSPLLLQAQSVSAPPKFASEEYVLFGDINVGGGEAEIAVNPKDPNNILVGILAGHHRLADGKLPDGKPSTRDQRLGQPDWAYSVLAVTHDRGATWTFREDQLRNRYGLCNCFDAFVEAADDGTLYWGCLPETTRDGSDYKREGSIPEGGPKYMSGGSYIMSSTDEGRTWTEPSEIMGRDSAGRWPNGGKNMVWALSSPWDRAEVVIDNKTGTLFSTGHGRGGNPVHEEDSITSSHDKGKTWGPIFTWDSEGVDDPQSGRGSIDAGNGRLAIAYIASKTPDASAKCPCIVFETSTNDGKTFERHVIQNAAAVSGRSVFLAGDPGTPGRYAVMAVNSTGDQLLVYRTDDYGRTWSAPVIGAQAPSGMTVTLADTGPSSARAAVKYSRNGEMGILWRAAYPDKSFDVWSSLSFDGGKTFHAIQVSHATSPPKSRERGHFLVGDDYWDLDFDKEFVHFVWTDSRPGFLATWYGRVPLSAYQPGLTPR
jgi:hypothetical protein